jgi:hypothetical protein
LRLDNQVADWFAVRFTRHAGDPKTIIPRFSSLVFAPAAPESGAFAPQLFSPTESLG